MLRESITLYREANGTLELLPNCRLPSCPYQQALISALACVCCKQHCFQTAAVRPPTKTILFVQLWWNFTQLISLCHTIYFNAKDTQCTQSGVGSLSSITFCLQTKNYSKDLFIFIMDKGHMKHAGNFHYHFLICQNFGSLAPLPGSQDFSIRTPRWALNKDCWVDFQVASQP